MITIVDYGVGNVGAFLTVYRRLNIDARSASSPAELESATRLILPGVGDFDQAMLRLQASGMRPLLDELVMIRRTPVLGVCVGMQMLGRSSEEGALEGLGWIDGQVRSFRTMPGFDMALPHMGWNDVRPTSTGNGLFRGLEENAKFYFLHSFFFSCDRAGDSAALATYGGDFSCAVRANNVAGVQFHPEKSHRWGMQLLDNFAGS